MNDEDKPPKNPVYSKINNGKGTIIEGYMMYTTQKPIELYYACHGKAQIDDVLKNVFNNKNDKAYDIVNGWFSDYIASNGDYDKVLQWIFNRITVDKFNEKDDIGIELNEIWPHIQNGTAIDKLISDAYNPRLKDEEVETAAIEAVFGFK